MSGSVADVLVAEGLITVDQLSAAQTTSAAIGEPVLNVLVQQGAVGKKDVVRCTVRLPAWSSSRSWTCPSIPRASRC